MSQFRGPHLRLCALIIGAGGVRALQRFGWREAVERLVRSLVGDFESLAGGQSDDAGERQLVLGDLVLQREKLLLLRFQFDLGTKLVDGGRSSGAMLVAGAFIKGLRSIHLSAGSIDAGSGRDDLQIGRSDGLHDQIARILSRKFRGAQTFVPGSPGFAARVRHRR